MSVSIGNQIASVQSAIRAAPADGKYLNMSESQLAFHVEGLNEALKTLRLVQAKQRKRLEAEQGS